MLLAFLRVAFKGSYTELKKIFQLSDRLSDYSLWSWLRTRFFKKSSIPVIQTFESLLFFCPLKKINSFHFKRMARFLREKEEQTQKLFNSVVLFDRCNFQLFSFCVWRTSFMPLGHTIPLDFSYISSAS